jgi:hypothetical protein
MCFFLSVEGGLFLRKKPKETEQTAENGKGKSGAAGATV